MTSANKYAFGLDVTPPSVTVGEDTYRTMLATELGNPLPGDLGVSTGDTFINLLDHRITRLGQYPTYEGVFGLKTTASLFDPGAYTLQSNVRPASPEVRPYNYKELPRTVVLDTPLEDDPDEDITDRTAPGYVKNTGLFLFSTTHNDWQTELGLHPNIVYDPWDLVTYKWSYRNSTGPESYVTGSSAVVRTLRSTDYTIEGSLSGNTYSISVTGAPTLPPGCKVQYRLLSIYEKTHEYSNLFESYSALTTREETEGPIIDGYPPASLEVSLAWNELNVVTSCDSGEPIYSDTWVMEEYYHRLEIRVLNTAEELVARSYIDVRYDEYVTSFSNTLTVYWYSVAAPVPSTPDVKLYIKDYTNTFVETTGADIITNDIIWFPSQNPQAKNVSYYFKYESAQGDTYTYSSTADAFTVADAFVGTEEYVAPFLPDKADRRTSTDSATQLKGTAYRYGMLPSVESSNVITFKIGKVTAEWTLSTKRLQLSSYTDGVTFKYTINGGAEQTYSGYISVVDPSTVSFYATLTDMLDSDTFSVYINPIAKVAPEDPDPTPDFERRFWSTVPAIATQREVFLPMPPAAQWFVSETGGGDGMSPENPATMAEVLGVHPVYGGLAKGATIRAVWNATDRNLTLTGLTATAPSTRVRLRYAITAGSAGIDPTTLDADNAITLVVPAGQHTISAVLLARPYSLYATTTNLVPTGDHVIDDTVGVVNLQNMTVTLYYTPTYAYATVSNAAATAVVTTLSSMKLDDDGALVSFPRYQVRVRTVASPYLYSLDVFTKEVPPGDPTSGSQQFTTSIVTPKLAPISKVVYITVDDDTPSFTGILARPDTVHCSEGAYIAPAATLEESVFAVVPGLYVRGGYTTSFASRDVQAHKSIIQSSLRAWISATYHTTYVVDPGVQNFGVLDGFHGEATYPPIGNITTLYSTADTKFFAGQGSFRDCHVVHTGEPGADGASGVVVHTVEDVYGDGTLVITSDTVSPPIPASPASTVRVFYDLGVCIACSLDLTTGDGGNGAGDTVLGSVEEVYNDYGEVYTTTYYTKGHPGGAGANGGGVIAFEGLTYNCVANITSGSGGSGGPGIAGTPSDVYYDEEWLEIMEVDEYPPASELEGNEGSDGGAGGAGGEVRLYNLGAWVSGGISYYLHQDSEATVHTGNGGAGGAGGAGGEGEDGTLGDLGGEEYWDEYYEMWMCCTPALPGGTGCWAGYGGDGGAGGAGGKLTALGKGGLRCAMNITLGNGGSGGVGGASIAGDGGHGVDGVAGDPSSGEYEQTETSRWTCAPDREDPSTWYDVYLATRYEWSNCSSSGYGTDGGRGGNSASGNGGAGGYGGTLEVYTGTAIGDNFYGKGLKEVVLNVIPGSGGGPGNGGAATGGNGGNGGDTGLVGQALTGSSTLFARFEDEGGFSAVQGDSDILTVCFVGAAYASDGRDGGDAQIGLGGAGASASPIYVGAQEVNSSEAWYVYYDKVELHVNGGSAQSTSKGLPGAGKGGDGGDGGSAAASGIGAPAGTPYYGPTYVTFGGVYMHVACTRCDWPFGADVCDEFHSYGGYPATRLTPDCNSLVSTKPQNWGTNEAPGIGGSGGYPNGLAGSVGSGGSYVYCPAYTHPYTQEELPEGMFDYVEIPVWPQPGEEVSLSDADGVKSTLVAMRANAYRGLVDGTMPLIGPPTGNGTVFTSNDVYVYNPPSVADSTNALEEQT
jgi:hypothetical protein